ncbi:hypothetical protein [Streptomyces yanii]|uniref:Uncharacterized protein n=1 Tax=Streptomyces yanii TaxID=78510 RepID=A0ABV5RIQ3_9ACTN
MTSPQTEGQPDGYGPFAHLTAPNVLLYRVVMRVCRAPVPSIAR